jgi:hypothetical protein
MMNAGKGSVLSVFKALVWVAWLGTLLVTLYLAVGVIFGSLDARVVSPWIGAKPWDTGLAIGISPETLAPDQWRSFCFTVGTWNVAGAASALFAVDQVRKIMGSDMTRSPFTSHNMRRVRIAGVAVMCGAVAKALRDTAFGRFVEANVKIDGALVGYVSDLGLSTAFLGLMILAVAEVMRHGVMLQEEQDLTV